MKARNTVAALSSDGDMRAILYGVRGVDAQPVRFRLGGNGTDSVLFRLLPVGLKAEEDSFQSEFSLPRKMVGRGP